MSESKNKLIAFWNAWHKEWYDNLIINNKISFPKKINGWEVPEIKGGNANPMWHYFPEPYWGTLDMDEIRGLFLNINPGEGDKNQDFKNNSESLVKATYENASHDYCHTVSMLSNIRNNPTTNWMYKNRINWLQKLYKNNKIDISGYVFFDLVPWHSKSKSDIMKYALKNSDSIIEDVIKPISILAKEVVTPELRNKIIVRGSTFLDILNCNQDFHSHITSIEECVVLDRTLKCSKLSSLLSIIKMYDTDFYVFSGGASMHLPNLDYDVIPIGRDSAPIDLRSLLLRG